MALGTLTIDLVANTARLERDLGRANRLADRSANDMERRIRRTQTVARGIFGGIVIAGTAVLAAYRSQAQELDKLAKQSDKLGIIPEELAAIRFAGEQTGVAIATMDMALQRFTRRAAEAAQGTGEAKDALKELNVNAEELVQMPLEQQLGIIADRFGEVDTQADRVRLAMKLFDSEGVSLVNTLELGSEGLQEMRKTADELGITVNRLDLQKIEDANDAAHRMQEGAAGLANTLTIELAPALETIFNWLTGISGQEGAIEKTFGTMAFLAEEFAASIGGTAHDDLVRMREELDEINRRLESRRGNPDVKRQLRERKEELEQLIALRMELGNTGGTIIPINRGNDQEESGGPSQATINAYETLVNTMQKRIDLTGRESELAKVVWELEQGRFTELTTEQEDQLRALAEKLDFLKMEQEAIEELEEAEKKRREENQAFIDEAQRSVQQSLADFLFDPFDEGLDGMLKGFARTLQRMAAEATAAKIGEKIFGMLGGLGGGGGGLAGLFAGLFDGGGHIPAGRVGVVGEKRREIVDMGGRAFLVPGPARVTSGAATASMGSGVNVNLNIHNNAGVQIGQEVRRDGNQVTVDVMVDAWHMAARDGRFDELLFDNFGVARANAPAR